MRAYLHEIGRVPLLTHEDEIVLGKQVQKLMALLEIKTSLEAQIPVAEETTEEIAKETAADSTAVVEVSDKDWGRGCWYDGGRAEQGLAPGPTG